MAKFTIVFVFLALFVLARATDEAIVQPPGANVVIEGPDAGVLKIETYSMPDSHIFQSMRHCILS
jgi:hypothetical protein